VDARMSQRGGVVRDPSRRARIAGTAAAAGAFALLLGGLLILLPPARVVRGDELQSWHVRTLQDEGLLRPGEEIYYFYTNAWFIRSDVNLLTSNGVVSFASDRTGDCRRIVPYEEIGRVELFREERVDSVIEVVTIDGDDVTLYASPRHDGDRAFVDRLKAEWRARVPVAADDALAP
jgi:hypothetical protein